MLRGAGAYRDPVTFERLGIAGDDGFGNVTQTWTTLFTSRCWLREAPGREAVAAGAVEATARATLQIRRSADALGLHAGDRAVVRGDTWNIVSAPSQVGGAPGEVEMIVERGVGV